MPLVVPILRLLMLMLNVYETYKTLKEPKPSARNGGRPSIRAQTQRKRDMKGCLAVWIVWCCFATYDRTLDGIVRLFIPFYDEIKTVVILFFVLTRARGAEPIYLHILRPIIKPYTGALDSVLDIICSSGDLIFLLSTTPFRLAVSWWHDLSGHTKQFTNAFHSPSFHKRNVRQDSSPGGSTIEQSSLTPASRTQSHTRKGSRRNYPPRRMPLQLYQSSSAGSLRTSTRSRSQLEEGVNPRSTSSQYPTGRAPSRGRRHAPANLPQGRSSSEDAPQMVSSSYQIWYPSSSLEPPSEDGQPLPADTVTLSNSVIGPGSSTASAEETAQVEITAVEVDEWRLYPPFPAAYPPTPCHAATILPVHLGLHQSSSGSDGMVAVPVGPHVDSRSRNTIARNTNDSDQDSENGDEEDAFDVTLTSPVHARNGSLLSSPSTAGSVKSRPTALTTTDNTSPMRTRTTSVSSGSISLSDSMSISDSSSMAERNRTFQQIDSHHMVSTVVERVSSSHVTLQQASIRRTGKQNIDDDDDDLSDSDSDDTSTTDSAGVAFRRPTGYPKQAPGNAYRSTRNGDSKLANGSTTSVNNPSARSRGRGAAARRAPQRSSSRLANLGAEAPPTSRRVIGPAAGSSHTTVNLTSNRRLANDRNSAKKK